jgi:hypothetical protein
VVSSNIFVQESAKIKADCLEKAGKFERDEDDPENRDLWILKCGVSNGRLGFMYLGPTRSIG